VNVESQTCRRGRTDIFRTVIRGRKTGVGTLHKATARIIEAVLFARDPGLLAIRRNRRWNDR
jgi:hypothetical protein